MVLATKKNCQRVLAAGLRVVSAMTGNPPLKCRPRGLRRCETMWVRLSKNRRRSIKNQFAHSDRASNVDEKWSKNHGDLMYPGRVNAPQSSEKILTSAFL